MILRRATPVAFKIIFIAVDAIPVSHGHQSHYPQRTYDIFYTYNTSPGQNAGEYIHFSRWWKSLGCKKMICGVFMDESDDIPKSRGQISRRYCGQENAVVMRSKRNSPLAFFLFWTQYDIPYTVRSAFHFPSTCAPLGLGKIWYT